MNVVVIAPLSCVIKGEVKKFTVLECCARIKRTTEAVGTLLFRIEGMGRVYTDGRPRLFARGVEEAHARTFRDGDISRLESVVGVLNSDIKLAGV